jgi:hypothetical protein
MHTNKSGFEKIIAKYSKVSDPDMLNSTVEYAYDFVEKIPLVDPKAIENTLDLVAQKRPAAKQADSKKFYDNSLVQELVKEGFFESLWGNNLQSRAAGER